MKIVNGLFNPTYGYARAFAGVALGVLLIIRPEVAAKTVVQIIGCFLIAIGAISFVLSFKKDKKNEKDQPRVDVLSVNGIFDLIFGLILLLIPNVFVAFLMFGLGLMLFVFGVGQIVNLISAKKFLTVSWAMFVLPVLTTVCGIALIFKPFESTKTLFIVFGVALVVYGVSELISTIKLRKVIKLKQSYEYRVEDSDYEEVKDVE
ncbi:MAG: DUF308 domain-containing protein [Bacteroidales bacterium]|nr:DUF308 domain-containing protein [Bacteroidales bacterium]MDD4671170.1 DUF308 domain-containing protein [Bacteroidales bacterium]